MRVTEFGGGFQLREQNEAWEARQTDGAFTARTNYNPLEANELPGTDSVGATTGTASTLAIGASTNGYVHSAGDRDWYAVTMVAGQSYTFTLNGSTLVDPYLEIYNSSGALIGFDDDFGTGINAQLRWTATTTGTYYINAQAYPDSGTTGGYTLSAVTSAPANPIDSINYHFTMPTTSISIWFATTGYTNPAGDGVIRNWTQPEIDAVMAALGAYTAITPLTFSVAASQGAATWIFSLAELEGNTLGYFAVADNFAAFDPNVPDFTAGLTPGGNSWATVIHEAGHGLGMAHPHDNGAEDYGDDNSEVMQGVIDPFESFGTFNMNQGVFTTMSYNDGWRTSGFGGPPNNLVGGQATPMALDVALMQQRYGVNTTTGAGNTAYTLALAHSAYRAIWDVNGSDTISYSGNGAATIDLRAATLQNAVGGGGYVSFVQGVHGGFTIANGVLIENATGGSGADTLIGNDANNILNGGGGVDTMTGGLGNDTYYVDHTNDIVVEGANGGADTVIAAASYTLLLNIENLTLTGDGSEIHGTGNGLNNTITGDNGNNGLQGLSGDDVINGGGGNDQILGGDGQDTLDGGTGADRIDGGGGDDIIYYDASDLLSFVVGGSGTDLLVFTTGPAPSSFNLVAQGFESAEGRFTVPGATFTQYYDTQWRLRHEIGNASNGSSWFIDYDEASTEPYQVLNQDRDAGGQLTREYGTSDNGSTWNQFFDTDGTHPYVSILQVHTAGGIYANEHGVSDNGSTWDTFFDVDGTNPFQWIQQVRDANGVLAQEEGLADGGTSWFTDYDETGTTDYVFYQNVYDTLDRLSFQSGEYDTGFTWTIDYDETNTQPWTSIRNDYDDNGVLIGTTTIFDGP